MSKSGTYDPQSIEGPVYEFWDRGGYFASRPDPQRPPFTIVIPPPNVTGALHLGHALNNTLQDLLIRRKRMQGFNACWLPGTDHAGIATQAVVEKRLKEQENKTRNELGREALVERIWKWKDEYEARILNQLRRMGCSCDWSRTHFTLDDDCARAVYETFFRLFKDGLIFRGTRLVNWDPALQTAVADDEITHEKVKGNLWHIRYPLAEGRGIEPGASLCIATTRPETMLGDTALAVHPDDPRYQHLIGKEAILPLVNRRIPIIADPILVDSTFGTGVVKVTPGHDPNDYECGKRNGLQFLNILTNDGRIRDDEEGKRLFEKYAGLDRYAARKQVVADLEAAGLIEKVEPHEHEVGHSDRSKTPIEPMLSEQWFVKMAPLAEPALEAVRDGRVTFHPERYAKTYLDWLGEKRDWCISRQLWWGHRIPVWTVPLRLQQQGFRKSDDWKQLWKWIDAGRVTVRALSGVRELTRLSEELGRETAKIRLFGGHSLPDEAVQQGGFCPASEFLPEFSEFAEKAGLEQDPDVLDTWFSSALWPHSTFEWANERQDRLSCDRKGAVGEAVIAPPSHAHAENRESMPPTGLPPGSMTAEKNRRDAGATLRVAQAGSDIDYYYPTSVLSTARDIISLWVARMVMTGLYNVGRVPFQHVCIHPVIQDGQGRRMSKSLGNGVDPLDLIEMYGADAMRFTLASMAGETQDIRIPVKAVKTDDGRSINTSDRFELGRNFCNKLWQAATGLIIPSLASAAGDGGGGPRTLSREQLALEDQWILSRLQTCIAEVDRRIDAYQFNEACTALYAFFWGEFCDWYLELAKPRLSTGVSAVAANSSEGSTGVPPVSSSDATGSVARQILAHVLDQSLRLLHPIMPFVSEALWKQLNDAAPWRGVNELAEPGDALIVADWPGVDSHWIDPAAEERMTRLQDVIRSLRDVKARVNGIRAQARETVVRTLPRAVIRADAAIAAEFERQRAAITRLGQCDVVEIGPSLPKPAESASKVFAGYEAYVPLTGLANLNLERQRLRKEIDETRGHADRTAAKLDNAGFVQSAPPTVVERERERVRELREKLQALEENLAQISG